MAFIGVDLHTNSFTICRLEADGSEAFETFQLAASDLERFCLSVDADDELAVEATGNTAWFCGEIRPCVGRIVVVNPRQFQVIRKSVKKTDRNDARALAVFLSKDMLPETRLKRAGETELASLAQTRDMLVKSRTKLFNKIHGLFNRHGIKLKKEGFSDKRLRSLEIERFGDVEQVDEVVEEELVGVRVDQLSPRCGLLVQVDQLVQVVHVVDHPELVAGFVHELEGRPFHLGDDLRREELPVLQVLVFEFLLVLLGDALGQLHDPALDGQHLVLQVDLLELLGVVALHLDVEEGLLLHLARHLHVGPLNNLMNALHQELGPLLLLL